MFIKKGSKNLKLKFSEKNITPRRDKNITVSHKITVKG